MLSESPPKTDQQVPEVLEEEAAEVEGPLLLQILDAQD